MSRFPNKFEELLMLTVRSFYSEENGIVLETLLREKRYIKDEELASLLKLNHKQIRKILGSLKRAGFVKSENITEKNPATNQSHQHSFWFVDFKHTIDTITYRLHKISKLLEGDSPEVVEEDGDYVCPKCTKKYTDLEIDRILERSTGRFLCERDKTELLEKEKVKKAPVNLGKKALFREQLKPIYDQLKQVEGIPCPTFRSAAASQNAAAEGAAGNQGSGGSGSGGGGGSGGRSRPGYLNTTNEGVTIDVVFESDPAARAKAAANGTQQPPTKGSSKVKSENKASQPETKPGVVVPPWMKNEEQKAAATAAATTAATTTKQKDQGMNLFGPPETIAVTKVEDRENEMSAMEQNAEYKKQYYDALLRQQKLMANPNQDSSLKTEIKKRKIEEDTTSSIPKVKLELSDNSSFSSFSSKTPLVKEEEDVPQVKVKVENNAEGHEEEEEELIKVGDRMVPFSQVTDDDQTAMTPEEYKAFYEVYERYAASAGYSL